MGNPALDNQPGSKAQRVSGERQTGQIVKRIAYDPVEAPTLFKDEIPELGEPHPTFPDELFFIDADWKPVSGKYGDLVLNYSWKKSGKFELYMSNSTKDSPLKTHPNYELRWDHFLVALNEGATVPSWWNDSQNPLKTIEEFNTQNTDGDYKVVTNVNAAQDKVLSDRIKPKNTWQKPVSSVREKIWYKTEEDAANASFAVGKLGVPARTFGRDDNISSWLCTSAPITRDGGYWMVDRVWEYSQEINNLSAGGANLGWDFDIYPDQQGNY